MAIICPTVTASDPREYREQLESLEPFAPRIHFDFMDGEFTPTVSPRLEQAWWPANVQADLHIMYRRPTEHLETILRLHPALVIVHAEAEGDFLPFAQTLQVAGIRVGLALLQDSPVDSIAPAMSSIDHVLVFGGKLGYHGGTADLTQLKKVAEIRRYRPDIEIGWDGGVNSANIARLADTGIDVLNVGSFVTKSEDPEAAYRKLEVAI